jgi:site-specific DNA-methyltransferase (adenine-specific)
MNREEINKLTIPNIKKLCKEKGLTNYSKLKKADLIKKYMDEVNEEEVKEEDCNIKIENREGIEFLSSIQDESVDLILTDPPYITSSKTGMGELHKQIKENKEKGIVFVKTEEEWEKVKHKYADKKNMPEDKMKKNFMKYGSIYGSKYSVQTDYGEWDSQFTMEILESFIKEYYKKLKKGGTIIIFFDIWKFNQLLN